MYFAISGPAEQFLKCGGHTRLFNWGEGLVLKMVKGPVINLDFFPGGRPAVADHFNPLKLLFHFLKCILLIVLFFPQKWGALDLPAPPPARCLYIEGALTSVNTAQYSASFRSNSRSCLNFITTAYTVFKFTVFKILRTVTDNVCPIHKDQ